jgi:hypothetical protein
MMRTDGSRVYGRVLASCIFCGQCSCAKCCHSTKATVCVHHIFSAGSLVVAARTAVVIVPGCLDDVSSNIRWLLIQLLRDCHLDKITAVAGSLCLACVLAPRCHTCSNRSGFLTFDAAQWLSDWIGSCSAAPFHVCKALSGPVVYASALYKSRRLV